ncbi:MAG: hypothetical protein IPL88_16770 [Rhizobiales bacterium]|nr:hypothetical protein [Hyphomicrobiales bacterium]
MGTARDDGKLFAARVTAGRARSQCSLAQRTNRSSPMHRVVAVCAVLAAFVALAPNPARAAEQTVSPNLAASTRR